MAWTLTLTDETGTINLNDGTTYRYVAAHEAVGLRIIGGQVVIPLLVAGATADALFNAIGSLEAACRRAAQSSRSAAGPHESDADRTVLAVTPGTTDTSYAKVRGGSVGNIRVWQNGLRAWIDLSLVVDGGAFYGSETEQTITATLTNGNASAAFYSSIPGDLPALVRAQVHDLSSSGAINRLRISTFGRTGMATADIDTIMSLTAAGGATATASADSIDGTDYIRESITAAAAANTVAEGYIPAELARGPLDIYVRNRGAAATLPTVNTPGLAANTWIAPRQVAYGTASNVTSFSPSFDQDTLKGSTIVLCVAIAASGQSTITSIGSRWSLGISALTTDLTTYQYYDEDAETYIGETISCGTGFVTWTLLEFDHVPASSRDRHVSLITTGSGTSVGTGTTESTRQLYEMVVAQAAGLRTSASAPTFTWSGYTERSDQTVNNGSNRYMGCAVATAPTTARGTQTTTATASATCSQRLGAIGTYRAAGGLTAGSYAIKLVAVNTDGSKSAASASASQTVTGGQAVTVTITGTATAYYEVWWQRDGGQWYMQRTDGPTATYYLYLETGTPGTPPTLATYNTLFLRLAYGLRSGTVLSYTDWVRAYPSAIGWGFPWSGQRYNTRPFTLTLAPSPTITGKPAEDWYVAVQGYSPDVTGNLDIDGLWLAHHGSPQFETWHQASDGVELGLASRAIWDIDRRHDGRHSVVLQGTRTLTASGNEITDATRRTATQGDGRTIPGGIGSWRATTNLITNGGLETNTTGWVNSGGTISRVTTQYKFGAASGQIVTDNAGANEGAYHAFTGAAATAYSVSAWVRGTGGTVRIALYDNVSGKQASSPVTLSTTWQRVTVTATTGGGSATFRAYIETNAQQSITFQVDGVQVEAQGIPTPYVHTDGGTASRSAASVTVPAAALNATQAWVAFRFIPTCQESNSRALFAWFDDANNGIYAFVAASGGGVTLGRASASNFESVTNAGSGITYAGASHTLVMSWESTALYYSINGAARTDVGGTSYIPTLAAASIYLGLDNGMFGGTARLDGTILWTAMGTGTLTDADVAALHAHGDTPPRRIDLPPTSTPTLLWDGAVSTSAGTGADIGQARQRGDLLIEPGNALVTVNAEVGSGVSNCETCKYLIRLWTTPRFTRLIGDV